MADRNALGKIGLMLSTATVLVMMMVGALVVNEHLTGRLVIDDGLRIVTLPSAAR